jgi:PAS domain S-box-containing protein
MVTSELRYRRLFETAQDAILILNADTSQITDANPFVGELLGYSKQELVGKKLWEIGPFRYAEEAKTAFKDLQDRGYIRYEDLPLETKDGRQIAVEFVSNTYAVNGDRVIQCIIRDITARRNAEEELRKNREFLTRVTDSISEVILTVDIRDKLENRVISYVNKAVETVFGYKPEEFIKRSPEMQYADHNEFLKGSQKLRDAIDRGDSVIENELLLRRKSGEIFTADVTVSLFRTEGRVTQFISTIKDITNPRKLVQF